MKIIEVNSPETIKAFHKVPFIIYKEDKQWIPHLKQDVEDIFTPDKNKYFEHGKVIRWILKDAQDQLIGRVAAFINDKTAKTFKQPTGGMGFFECIEDKEAAFLLFDQCKKWLTDNGMEAMDGPINFGEKDRYWGLLVEGWESDPIYLMTYNPPYYKDFFEAYGFKTYYEQIAFYRSMRDPLQQKFIERAERISQLNGYTFETIKKNNLAKYAEDFRAVYNSAWQTHDNFKGMSQEQAMNLVKKLKPVIDEELFWFAYHEGKPVGFFLSLPELNEIFKHVNGNLNWWGKLKFLWYKTTQRPKTAFCVAFGIGPGHQGKGVEGAIFNEFGKRLQPTLKYEHLIITWIGDFNPKMIRIIEYLGTKRHKKLITYRKLFDENAPFERAPFIQ